MIPVIRITGKAKDVFSCIRLMAEKAKELTMGEIVRLKKQPKEE